MSIVSYYKLDGSSSDAFGSNNGTDTAITYSIGNGKISQGGGFTRASNSKILTNFQFSATTSSKSFSCWINPGASRLRGWAIGGGANVANQAFGLYLATDGAGDLGFFGNGAADMSIATIPASAWTHVVVTYNGTTLTAYVNGVSVASAARTLATAVANTYIGRRTGDTESWEGAIDEVAFYTHALSATEVTALYNGGLGATFPLFLLDTDPVTSISLTTAVGNGEVFTDDSSTITERGICWSLTPTPTTANFKSTASGTVGVFTANMSGLSPSVTYYVRAYFINSNGTFYGSELSFTTLGALQYDLQRDIGATDGQTFVGQITVTGTVGTVTVKLGSTGTSTVIAAGTGASTFTGTYSGLSGLIITRSATFNGTVDNIYYAQVPLGTSINWSLDSATIVTAVNSSVFFKRIEDDVFNSFRFYRYLDLLFKDLDGYVTVTVRDEREDLTTTRTKTFSVGNTNPGTVSPFQKKRISFLIKNQAVIIGLSNGNIGETFSIAQFLLTGHKKTQRMFAPSKIQSL